MNDDSMLGIIIVWYFLYGRSHVPIVERYQGTADAEVT